MGIVEKEKDWYKLVAIVEKEKDWSLVQDCKLNLGALWYTDIQWLDMSSYIVFLEKLL